MKAALCAVGSLLSLFISMFMGLQLLALHATKVFTDVAPSENRVLLLKLASLIFFSAALLLLRLAVKELRDPSASVPR